MMEGHVVWSLLSSSTWSVVHSRGILHQAMSHSHAVVLWIAHRTHTWTCRHVHTHTHMPTYTFLQSYMLNHLPPPLSSYSSYWWVFPHYHWEGLLLSRCWRCKSREFIKQHSHRCPRILHRSPAHRVRHSSCSRFLVLPVLQEDEEVFCQKHGRFGQWWWEVFRGTWHNKDSHFQLRKSIKKGILCKVCLPDWECVFVAEDWLITICMLCVFMCIG